jgi:hypothetical protein
MDMAFDIPLQLVPSLRLTDFAGPPVFPPQSMQWATMMRNSVPSGTLLTNERNTGMVK